MEVSNEKGGTLIEAIVAMLILALLVTGLNACVMSLIKTNLSSKELSTATSNAYNLFEQIRRTDYSSIVSNSDVVGSKYLRAWTVTTETSQKKIDVTIAWPAATQKHKIALSTIIAQP
jgi:Tfp pilus assembly protein PilV